MYIDHITLAGANLATLREDLLASGVETEYGGVHSNGMTHMALAGLGDGSYLELVAPVLPGGRVTLWSDWLLPEFGGSAWTAPSENIAAEFSVARQRGIAAKGPVLIQREKPNGEVGAWDLGYYGDKQPGGTLPFLVQDHTPRSVRVKPGLATGQLFTRWTAIVLAVYDVAAASAQLRLLYGWDAPHTVDGISHFAGTPIFLTSPIGHLEKFGESPCAAVLGLAQGVTTSTFRTNGTSLLAEKSIHWLDLRSTTFRIGLEPTQ